MVLSEFLRKLSIVVVKILNGWYHTEIYTELRYSSSCITVAFVADQKIKPRAGFFCECYGLKDFQETEAFQIAPTKSVTEIQMQGHYRGA